MLSVGVIAETNRLRRIKGTLWSSIRQASNLCSKAQQMAHLHTWLCPGSQLLLLLLYHLHHTAGRKLWRFCGIGGRTCGLDASGTEVRDLVRSRCQPHPSSEVSQLRLRSRGAPQSAGGMERRRACHASIARLKMAGSRVSCRIASRRRQPPTNRPKAVRMCNMGLGVACHLPTDFLAVPSARVMAYTTRLRRVSQCHKYKYISSVHAFASPCVILCTS